MNEFAPDLQRARVLVAEKLGIDLANHQQSNLRNALAEGMPRVNSERRDLLSFLEDEDSEGPAWQRIASWITVGETSFFRHRAWFAALVGQILRPLVEERRRSGQRFLRIWSAGCASGEETYSLAMAATALIPDINDWSVSILGTDINPAAIEKARRGIYSAWSLRETEPAIRDRHFAALGGGSFQIDAECRRLATFTIFNLAKLPESLPAGLVGPTDLILCRNVIMYFIPDVQRRVTLSLGQSLAPGGWLATSPAESSAELFAPLRPVNVPEAIFFRRQASATANTVHDLDLGNAGEGRRRHRKIPSVATIDGLPLQAESHDIGTTSKDAAASLPPLPMPAEKLPLADHRLRRARVLADRGRLVEARAACEAVQADDPTALDADLLLTAVCLDMGDTEAALAAVRRVLFHNPASLDAIFLEASLLFRVGDVPRARRRMHQALQGIQSLPEDAVLSARSGATVGTVRQLAIAYLAGSG